MGRFRLGKDDRSGAKAGCFGFVFAGFASLFLLIGTGMAGHQAYRLLTARETPAVIEFAQVESHRGSKGGTTYKPVIGFSYVIGDRTLHSSDVYPLTSSSSNRSDAEQTVSSYHPGQQVRAWVNPTRPESAFLIKSVSFFPCVFMLFPMIHIAIGLGLALLPGQPPERRASRLGWLTNLWCGVGILAFGPYFLLGGTWSILVVICLLLYGAGAGGWIYARRKAFAQITPEASRGLPDEPPNPFRNS